MNVLETWQTEHQEDSAVGRKETGHEVVHLRILTGRSPHAVQVIPSSGCSIGRSGGDCELSLDDGRMSRKHARIERGVSGWQLQDLGARNRGFVDGRGYGPGARVALVDGSVLRLADTVMVFRTSPPTVDGRADSPVFPGVSPVAVAVRRRIDALRSGTGHVLIVGETGSGKERIAHSIGDQRAAHPFVTLNSAELSRDLARSELFGHARGSFTNAISNKPGLVDMAGEGVLFLDEIGELPLDVQPELLRFLEDGSYRPIGATELRQSAARVVAATHVDLDEAVRNNTFRRDLLARLRANNTPLQLPALRERREDILRWTELFFRQRERDPGITAWTPGALECLLLFPWTYNLRELRSVVGEVAEQAAQFPCGTELLPAALRDHRAALRASSSGAPVDEPTPQSSPDPAPPEPTQAEIEAVLRETQGNMRMTAQKLRVDRRKLYRLCDAFGITVEQFRAETQREDE